MSGSGWSSSLAFRWIELNLSLPTSIFRWPRLFASFFTPSWAPTSSTSAAWGNGALGTSGSTPRRWGPQSFRGWWPDLDFSIVDSVVWSFVTAFESVALVSMLCFFFVFCGCTL